MTDVRLNNTRRAVKYPKFKSPGDTVSGWFVGFEPDVEGRFGPEHVLRLLGDEGHLLVIRCPSTLARSLCSIQERLAGNYLRISFKEVVETKAGFEAKLFGVTVCTPDAEGSPLASAPASTEPSATPRPARTAAVPAPDLQRELPFIGH